MSSEPNSCDIHSYYFFNAGQKSPVSAFEEVTNLKVNSKDVVVIPVKSVESVSPQAEESWWNNFWNDGWTHITFGTVSTAFGIGILCLATGPAGWVTGGLMLSGAMAVTGGVVGIGAGVGQLFEEDPATKKLYAQIGDAGLSLNNLPGLVTGVGSYVITQDFDRSITNANIAGIVSGGQSLVRSSWTGLKAQKLFSSQVGIKSAAWSPRVRNVNAKVVGVNPRGLEGSHLIPQRTVKNMVQLAPERLKKPIEHFCNGPFCINFMHDTQHALVDSHRYRFLATQSKNGLRQAHPFMTSLIESHPKIADTLGFVPNLSSTAWPVAHSFVVTSGRAIKNEALSSSEK